MSAGKDLGAALPGWLVARVLVAGAFVLAVVASDNLAAGARPFQIDEGLLSWDGAWYHDIARFGYGGVPTEGLRFFPLFPLLGKVVSYPLFGNVGLGLVVVANVVALVCGMLIHRLALHETGDTALARRAAWLLALFPSAFVLVWGYSEGLMLAASIGAFLAMRQRRWGWVAVLAIVAALSRPLGLLLVVPIVIEVLPGLRAADHREQARRLGALLAPAVGAGIFFLYAAIRFDDWGAPLSEQSQFRGDAVDPFTRLAHGVGDLFGPESFGDGLHLPFAAAFVVLLVVVFRRWPVSYGAYAATILVMALSADNLNSLERYGLNAFPLVLGLATLTSDERIDRTAMAVGGATLLSLATLTLLGAYVP